MALQTGQRSTFNDTLAPKIDLSDALPIIVDPFDVPLFMRLQKRAPTVAAVKHEWLEEGLVPSTDSLAAAYVLAATSFTATEFQKFKKGYVLKIEDEFWRVSATPTSSTVSISNAYAGTANAAHANGTTIEIVGYAVQDGADPEPFATTDRVSKFNFHQMFQELVEVTDLDQWAQVYGVRDKYGHEVQKWLKTIAVRAEKSLIFGKRFEDTTNKTRTMGGLEFYITTNVNDQAGAAITEAAINARLESSYKEGAVNDVIAVGPAQKRKTSALILNTMRYYPRPNTAEAVGVSADEYISDFGRQEIVLDRNIPGGDLWILQTDLLAVIQGQPFTLEALSKTGTARKSQIVGWFSFEVKAEKRHGKLKNLSTA